MFLPMRAGTMEDRSPYGDFWWEPISVHTSSGIRVNSDAAMRLAAVYACVQLLAKTFATAPFKLYRPREDGGRDECKSHWLYQLIKRRPNRFQNPFKWRQMLMGHLCLRGNAYNRIYSDDRGQITDLIPQHPDCIKVELLPLRNGQDTGEWRYKIRHRDGSDEIVPRGQIWHLTGLSADGITGISPIEYMRETAGIGLAAQDYGARFFANDASPNRGWISNTGRFKDMEAKKLFMDSWQAAFTGANRHRTPVLEAGMEYHEVGVKNSDAQFLESRQFSVSEIARMFGVPPHLIGDLSRCMPADTLVFTRTGPKRIADVLPGDEVWSPTPHGPKLAKVLNNWANGVDEILEIRTTNRTVRCNAKHRLLVRRRHERPLNPGEVGGKNVCGQKVRIHWRTEYVAASDLRVGDTLIALDRLPAEGATKAPNGRALSTGFMEFCGLLLADGNILYQNGKPSGVTIARGANAGYMDRYRQVITAEFERYDGGNYRGDLIGIVRRRACVTLTEEARVTKFSSVLAGAELLTLGFSGTAFTKRVPGWAFETTEEFRLALLRGFLDGDGTVDAKGRITFYSANKPLLDDIRHLCMSVGVPVTNTRSDVNRKPAPGSKVLVPTRVWRFTCSDPGANGRIGSHDPRYIARFAQGKPFGRKGRAYPLFGGREFSDPGMSLSRISKINIKDAEPVFDIEVEGTHCFIADGVASHNSTNNNIEMQSLEYLLYTMTPLAEAWEASIAYDLCDDEALDPEFDLQRLLRADQKTRGDFNQKMFGVGAYSTNDIIRREGGNPVAGGDQRFIPVNMMPLKPNMPSPSNGQGDANDQPEVDESGEPLAPDDSAPGPSGKRSTRLLALAQSAVDRIVRKEVEALRKGLKVGHDAESIYAKHADFVAGALGIAPDLAAKYCARQIAIINCRAPEDSSDDLARCIESFARCELTQLAIRGSS